MQHKFATCLVAQTPQLPGPPSSTPSSSMQLHLLSLAVHSTLAQVRMAVVFAIANFTLTFPTGEDMVPVTLVSWGGGPHFLLAAVEGSHIHIFSLKHYFDSVWNGGTRFSTTGAHMLHPGRHHRLLFYHPHAPDQQGRMLAIAGQGASRLIPMPVHAGEVDWIEKACEHLAVLRSDDAVLAADWTQAVDGLIASDLSGGLQMWRVQAPVVPSNPMSPTHLTSAQPTRQHPLSMEPIWRVSVRQPQSIVAAGVHAMAPCASAARGASKLATVWWPEVNQEVGSRFARVLQRVAMRSRTGKGRDCVWEEKRQ